MSEIIDLDILFDSDKKSVKFTAQDGRVFNVLIELKNDVALRYIQLHKDGARENDAKATYDLFTEFLKGEFSDVTHAYVREKISWKHIMMINKLISQEILDAISKFTEAGSGGSSKKK